MNRELKRVTIVILAMFAALFVSVTTIQFFSADALANDARNARTINASYSKQRGPILVAGQPIAQSVPSNDQYKYQRTYTNGPLYSAVTGYFTLDQGTTGIESAMNQELSGTSDSQFLSQLNSIVTGQNPQGASVELTIDPKVQQAAYDALGSLKGAVIAVDPKTGRILAMVSKPDYDPNILAVHDTDKVISTYNDLLNNANSPLINRTLDGDLDPPGSTFKIVTSSTALQAAGLSADYQLPNLDGYPLPGSSSIVHNAGGGTCGPGATVSIQTAFVLSCNIPMAELGVQIGRQKLTDMAKAYGYTTSFDSPIPVEASQFPNIGDDAQLALSSFGQASVRSSPMQIVEQSMAVANGGVIMQPNLVDSVRAPDLTVLKQFEAKTLQTPITSITASTLSSWMVEAVDSGAATNARIDGVKVAGKTGTAENGAGDPYTLWFTGFAPADNPQVAVAVVVQNGGGLGESGTGNDVAAPIAKKVLEAVLNK
ncbi:MULTISPECIES: penicillin-binding transpeptidase domain-containing protein [Subtercola]|uniref:Penicillin-binding protein 2 n=1 Tax=Subtercola vilae TaxID=2056433 RepID=A0A4T2CB32_9MICO|nr:MULTISPECIES: penicillin-binding transpeptidase domain-containing protein [Subtercola]MEA9985406.1 penicillin-binding transpeptidase domain-containing protein [Subtercola sp. RTI3]TIH40852.1 penicillin-binding protein 2 [Subtercola vilae]